MATKVQLHRASEYMTPTLGHKLDEIEDVEVVLTAYALSRRTIENRETDFVEVHCVALPDFEKDSDAETTRYTAWSPSLAERLRQIPQAQLPVIGTFKRSETTQRGFTAWILE